MPFPFSTAAVLDYLPKPGSSLLLEESPLSMRSSDCSYVFCIESETIPCYLLSLTPICVSALYLACNRHGAIGAFWPLMSLQILEVIGPLGLISLFLIIIWT